VIDDLVEMLPQERRPECSQTLDNLANMYEGQDLNTMGIMWWAAKRDRFDEYATKLTEYHEEKAQHIPPEQRSAVAGQNIKVLKICLQKEYEIREGRRSPKDREYLPRQLQNLMTYTGAIELEIFFFNCYRDLDANPNEE
jgi:hypothetical protein